MMNNRALLTQGAITLAALLLGGGVGHWMTKGQAVTAAPAKPVTTVAVTHSAPKQDRRSLADSSKSITAPADRKSLEEIMKGPSSGTRTRELEEYVKNLDPANIGAALKQLRGLPQGTARDLASGLLVAHWLETDPEGALRFAAENHDFDYITADVFQQLASADAQAALTRAQGIADPNARYQALRGVLSYMADQDPLGALRLAGTLGSFPNNEPLSQMIYKQWSSIDPQAAAIQAALTTNPTEGGWRSPVGQVLRNWAGQDPLGAIAWSTAQSDPAAQARDIAQVVRQWSRDDQTAAANWVNTLSPGATRDAAVASLAFSLGGSDPSAALRWAESISDVTQRDTAVQRLSREIMYRNPANGAAILQAAGIPQNLIPPPQGQGGGRRGGH